MKKLLLFAIALLAINFSKAQNSLQLQTVDGTEILNGHHFEIVIPDVNEEIESPILMVKNVSDQDLTIKVRRDIVEEVEGSVNYFCALGLCLPPFQDEYPSEYTLTANTTVSEADGFYAHYAPSGFEGTTTINYKYFDVNNSNDTISFTIDFIAGEVAGGSMKLKDLDGNEIVDGQIIEVKISDLNGEIESPEILVENVTDRDINIRVRRESIEVVDGSVNYFCALGLCLPPDQDELTRDFLLAGNTTASEENAFYAHYSPMGNEGKTKLSYKYFNVDDENDAISFEVHFDALTGIDDDLNIGEVSVYPNPAQDQLNFSFSELLQDNTLLMIYNVQGVLMAEIAVSHSNNVVINIADYPQGMYFYRLESTGKFSSTYKFIKE